MLAEERCSHLETINYQLQQKVFTHTYEIESCRHKIIIDKILSPIKVNNDFSYKYKLLEWIGGGSSGEVCFGKYRGKDINVS
jgi:hypothetical protein